MGSKRVSKKGWDKALKNQYFYSVYSNNMNSTAKKFRNNKVI